MADPRLPLDPEMDLLAAELALGLLEGTERLDAQRLRLEDPAFAAAVAAWEREGLAWLDEAPEQAPSPAMWSRIEASLARGPVAMPGPTALGETAAGPGRAAPAPAIVRDPGAWRPFAIAASLAAVLFAGLWAFATPERIEVPVEQPLRPEALSVAQINAPQDGMLLSALYDRATGRLFLRLAEIPDASRVPQLWLIDDTGTPRSLGFGTRGEVTALELSAEQRAIIESAGTIALSLEQPAATPHEVPTDVLGAANLAPLDPS